MIDANTGAVLFRHNRKQSADGTLGATTVDVDAPQVAPETRTFTGAYVPPACGPYHIFNVTPGKTSITTAAGTVNPANDIKLTLFYSNTLLNQYQEVASADTATSPEQITYQPVGGVLAGDYAVQVCPFPGAAQLDPYEYSGAFTTDDGQTGTGVVVNPLADTPRFRYFRANPPLDNSTADTRTTACMTPGVNGALPEGCTLQLRTSLLQSTWDTDVSSGTSTGTTIGNNAQTAQSWYSQLTPSAPYRPTSVNRTYVYPWTNAWNTARCNPSVLTPPNGNDTDAATANLFALHNLMHDWSYFLGFTEVAYNMQTNNRGQGGTAADPEIGNVQAAAVDGGSPQYVGRDNANQVTLQDGTPGISNMYLWQPIAGAFYAPCVDGDYDMSVVGHEYGHGIQNRMAGGPDDGLSGQQGRSMGESWADLTAVEFLNGFNLLPTATESPFAVGPYVTGNGYRGIRSYNMSESPLNYANLEYDGGGTTSPHADGEIWSATNFDIRQSLMNKYNAQFPANDVNAQYLCASGQRSAELCPGNRRWIQIMHDAFLLQPGSTSMLTARDAYLAADMMRFGGANQPELWTAFARRGMGVNASSPTPSYANNGADNVNATPDYSVPPQFGNNATITFQAVASDQSGTPAVDALVFVGDYEARAMPIADTNPTTAFTGTLIRPFDATTMMQSVSVPFSFAISPTAKFVPGTYQFTVTGRGYGTAKLSLTFAPGETRTVVLPLQTNLASATQGASVTSNGTATIDKNVAKLIDDTEETNFARLGTSVAEMLATRLTVDLKGAVQLVRRVQISTVQRPQDSRDAGGDTGGQSRFSTLRQFELLSCNAAAGADCANQDNFSVIYTSPADAFPGNNPRPVVPELDLREFDIPDTLATHLQLHVLQSQCTGGPAYQGEQDNDNLDATDCDTGTVGGQAATAGRRIRIAEFQVYGTEPAAPPTAMPLPTTLPTLTATPTSTATGVPPTNTPIVGATNTATTMAPTNTVVPSPTTGPGLTLKLYLPFVRR